MQETCWIHAGYMQDTCILRGNHDTYGIHQRLMRDTCGINAGYTATALWTRLLSAMAAKAEGGGRTAEVAEGEVAEGFELVTSHSSGTGFKGVTKLSGRKARPLMYPDVSQMYPVILHIKCILTCIPKESQIHLRYMSDTSRYMYLGRFLGVILDT